MKSNIFRVSFVLFLTTLMIGCVGALAQNRDAKGEVSGSFTVRYIAEPKTVELKYVYAEWGSADDRVRDKNASLELIFSDQPIQVEDGLERLHYIAMMSAE